MNKFNDDIVKKFVKMLNWFYILRNIFNKNSVKSPMHCSCLNKNAICGKNDEVTHSGKNFRQRQLLDDVIHP